MALQPGDKLGPYTIVEQIGEGGMGEVYKARDPRLSRDVAVKVSKTEFTERFGREARAVAALNHPNICQIYDVGPNYLVMEFIDGSPLRGPLPLATAIEYGVQILDALAEAHKKHIIHRDLKPGNILVKRSGIKLLDFGLAKQSGPLAPTEETQTALTGTGGFVGTLPYMAPEQLQALPADARSDIFSFGCVLYELLTGRRAFPGASPAAIIGAILHEQPEPLEGSHPLAALLARCLEKDPDNRFQTARDLRYNLTLLATGTPEPKRRTGFHWAHALAAAGLLTAGVFGWLWLRAPRPVEQVLRLAAQLPGGAAQATGKAISPDGGSLAVIARAEASAPRYIYVRNLDSQEWRVIKETEGVTTFVWAPDSRSIAFADAGGLRRVDVDGNNSRLLGPMSVMPDSLTWGGDGTLLFRGASDRVISRVSADGGAVAAVTALNRAEGEDNHDFASFLPDNRHFVIIVSRPGGRQTLELGSLESKTRTVLTDAAYGVCWREPDGVTWLLFQRGSSILAQVIDTEGGRLLGRPIPISEDASVVYGRMFLVSAAGALAYSSAGAGATTRLRWFDRRGGALGEIESSGTEFAPVIAPDGKRVAAIRVDSRGVRQVWVYDSRARTWKQLTFDAGGASVPVWTPDGTQIVYTVQEGESVGIYIRDASGAGSARLVGKQPGWLQGVSPDGNRLLYVDFVERELRSLALAGGGAPQVVSAYKTSYYPATYSPDGKYVTFTSSESGRPEVYVMALPPGQGKWKISNGGGGMSAWRGDGKELFYVNDRQILAVDVTSAPEFRSGAPRPLFQAAIGDILDGRNQYAVSPEGEKFLVSARDTAGEGSIQLVWNWPLLLRNAGGR